MLALKFFYLLFSKCVTDTSVFDLTLNEEEELILLSSNRDLILKHSEESINSFCISIRCEYPLIAKKKLYLFYYNFPHLICVNSDFQH